MMAATIESKNFLINFVGCLSCCLVSLKVVCYVSLFIRYIQKDGIHNKCTPPLALRIVKLPPFTTNSQWGGVKLNI